MQKALSLSKKWQRSISWKKLKKILRIIRGVAKKNLGIYRAPSSLFTLNFLFKKIQIL